jgi:hypothetical protein
MIEGEQSLVGERVKKLDHEKGVAYGLLLHQLHQLLGVRRIAAKCIHHQASQVVNGERSQANVLHPRSRPTDRIEFARQRMSGIDIVVPIGTD